MSMYWVRRILAAKTAERIRIKLRMKERMQGKEEEETRRRRGEERS